MSQVACLWVTWADHLTLTPPSSALKGTRLRFRCPAWLVHEVRRVSNPGIVRPDPVPCHLQRDGVDCYQRTLTFLLLLRKTGMPVRGDSAFKGMPTMASLGLLKSRTSFIAPARCTCLPSHPEQRGGMGGTAARHPPVSV